MIVIYWDENNFVDASPSVDEVFSKIQPFDEYKDAQLAKKIFARHKSKSLDFLSHRG